MSGPDDRRGTDGGEHPLDVDARFADIIAHFHDDEPSRPRFVDGSGPPGGPGTTDIPATEPTDEASPDGPTPADPGPTTPASGTYGPTAQGPTSQGPTPATTTGPAAPGPAAPGPATGPRDERRPRVRRGDADLERGATDDLAAMRRSFEARLAAEVDRAVDGADGGHFVPEEPPPLPRPDLPGRLAWAAVLAGPVLLLLCALLWTSAPSWLLGAIVTATVVGFGYLVWRLPRTRDHDDRGDGAIV